jgi:beta-glucosidase-like glycosyl hydrolase
VAILPVVLGCVRRYDGEAETISKTMDLERQIGQLITVAIPGNGMNRALESILRVYRPGGILLFGYNLSTFDANRKFIHEMQEFSLRDSGIPLFVSIDQEGGRVVRITSGVTQFPGNMAAGVGKDCGLVRRWGRTLGLELRMTGVNMNLAPVLDVNNNPFNPVINTRSFGPDPGEVAGMGACYIRGLQESRCMAVAKHFPGHGDTHQDSHRTLPVILRDMKRLETVELVPFKKAIEAGVEGIMTAHISYPEILGNDEPATTSPFFLTRMLRNDLKFRGLVITDALEMAAISGRQNLGEAAVKSIMAGADILLISSYGANIPLIAGAVKKAVIDKRISSDRLAESVCRILEAKLRYGIMEYEQGRIGAADISLTAREENILHDAGVVNSSLSRKGIYYFGDIKLLYPGNNSKRIFITTNNLLRRVLGENKSNVVSGINDLPRHTAGRGEKIIVYFHMDQPGLDLMRSVAGICKKRGFDLVLVSGGNPYPVMVSGMVQAGLLSFSNTEESIRQLGICLNGGFRPATGGGLSLVK